MPKSYFLLIILNSRSPVVVLIGHSTTTPLYLVQTLSKYLEINVARTEIGQKVIPVQDSSDPAIGLKEINSI